MRQVSFIAVVLMVAMLATIGWSRLHEAPRAAAITAASPQANGTSDRLAALETRVAALEATVSAAHSSTATPLASIDLELLDITFSQKDITIPANTDVSISLVNTGVTTHNFNIDELGIHSGDIAAGASSELIVNVPSGDYQFYCSIPGHKEAGMTGTLHVIDFGSEGPPIQSTSTPTPPFGTTISGTGPTIDLVDIAFNPKEVSIAANTAITLTITNSGAATHSFNIDALNIHSGDLASGDTRTISIVAPPGDYEFYCNIPGHKEAGMTGTLHVSSDPSLPATVPSTTNGTAVELSGTGQTATDPFNLPGGLYKLEATCQEGFFYVEMQPVTGDEYVSVNLVGNGPYAGSTNVSVDGGRYVLSVQCQAQWTVTIKPVV